MPVEVMWFLIVGCITLFGMISFAVYTISRANARIAQLRTEFSTRMLEKFGSASEFIEFVRSPEGRKILEGASMEKPVDAAKLLTSVRRGILLVVLGVTFLLTIPMFGAGVEPTGYIGMVLLALGVGYLVSAVVSRKLMHTWRDELSGNLQNS